MTPERKQEWEVFWAKRDARDARKNEIMRDTATIEAAALDYAYDEITCAKKYLRTHEDSDVSDAYRALGPTLAIKAFNRARGV